MSANALVVYTLTAAGNLGSAAGALSRGLDELRKRAVEASKMVTESTASMYAQLKKGDPIVSESTKKFAEGFAKGAVALAALGYGIDKLLSKNKEWAGSTERLKKTFNDLANEVAETVGPKASKWVDAFNIGFVYLKVLLVQGVVPAIKLVGETFTKMTDIAKMGFDVWKAIFSGDFEGAAALVRKQQSSFIDLLRTTEDKASAVAAAEDSARKAALAKYIEIRLAQAGAKSSAGVVTDPAAAAVAKKDQEQAQDDAEAWHDRAAMMHASIGSLTQAAADAAPKIDTLRTSLTNTINDFGSISSSIKNNPIDALGQAGPYGALIAALVNLVRDLPETTLRGYQDAANIIRQTAPNISEVIGPITEQIIQSIPYMVANVITLVPEIIAATITSLPGVIQAVIDAAADLIPAIIEGFRSLFSGVFGKLVTGGLGGDGRPLFETNLDNPNAEVSRFLGVHIGNPFRRTQLADGGTVTRTGLAVVHRGETYSGTSNERTVNNTNNNRSIMANIYAADPRRIAETLRYLTGDYGIGLSIEPFGGV